MYTKGDVPVMKALFSGMEDDSVEKQKCTGDEGRPRERFKMEAQIRACDNVGRCGWLQKMIRHPPRKEDVIVALTKMMRQPTAHSEKKPGGIPSKEPKHLDPMLSEPPTNSEGIGLEIIGDSKTVVDWISGNAKQTTTVDAVGRGSRGAEASIYAYTFFWEHNKEADDWVERGSESELTNGRSQDFVGFWMGVVVTAYARQEFA